MPKSTREVARELNVNLAALWNRIKDGRLTPPPKGAGGQLLWRDEDVRRARQALADYTPRRYRTRDRTA
jgi:hypothetical protein